MCLIIVCCLIFTFVGMRESVCNEGCAGLCSGGGWGVPAWYEVLTCFFLSVDAQAGLEPVVERNGCTFLSAAWHGEAFHGLGFQDVRSLILVDALFLLDGGRRMKERKKKKSPWGRRVS
jgi:hypothetical protein